MSEAITAISEYEKIFGAPTVRQTLFASDDEEYNLLRQYVIDHPKLEFDKTVLPFSGVSINNSIEINKKRTLEKPIEKTIQSNPQNFVQVKPESLHKEPTITIEKRSSSASQEHLFYIRRQIVQDVYCNASGFYDCNNDKFILKKGSLCAKDLPNQKFRPGDYERRKFLLQRCKFTEDGYYLLEDVDCTSPNLAALYVTGIIPRSGWHVWQDANGKSMNEIYNRE